MEQLSLLGSMTPNRARRVDAQSNKYPKWSYNELVIQSQLIKIGLDHVKE
jgi:hypothetical protein